MSRNLNIAIIIIISYLGLTSFSDEHKLRVTKLVNLSRNFKLINNKLVLSLQKGNVSLKLDVENDKLLTLFKSIAEEKSFGIVRVNTIHVDGDQISIFYSVSDLGVLELGKQKSMVFEANGGAGIGIFTKTTSGWTQKWRSVDFCLYAGEHDPLYAQNYTFFRKVPITGAQFITPNFVKLTYSSHLSSETYFTFLNDSEPLRYFKEINQHKENSSFMTEFEFKQAAKKRTEGVIIIDGAESNDSLSKINIIGDTDKLFKEVNERALKNKELIKQYRLKVMKTSSK